MKKKSVISKQDKLLIVIFEMLQGERNTLKYEDIFVKVFKKYPDTFHLRGYPEYPDTGDGTQRPLYDLRKEGLIQVRNKFVSITEKGITSAMQLTHTKSLSSKKTLQKLSRDITHEIDRIKNVDAFQLFVNGDKAQIVDSDFFNYLGATVRTERTDLSARIKTINDVIESIKEDDEYKILVDFHNYLFEKFKEIIKAKLSLDYPRRKT